MEKIRLYFDQTIKGLSDEKSRFIFLSTAVVMILAHGFCFMNVMYSHDSLGFADSSGVYKVSLGRWLNPFLLHRRYMASPWLMGMLSILYVSAAVVLVSKILDLGKMQGLSAGILFGANISLTALFCTYIYDADSDCLALFLACFSVYAFRKFPKVLNAAAAVFSLVACLALYQPYICLAAGLFLLALIKDAAECEYRKDLLRAAAGGIKELLVLLSAVLIYVPLMRAAAAYYGTDLSMDYNGAGNLSSLTLSDLIRAVPAAYGLFRDHFFRITAYNTGFIARVNLLTALLILLSLGLHLFCRKNRGSLILILPCLLLLPMGLNGVYLISNGVLHHLMIFAFCLVYLMPFLFKDPEEEREAGSRSPQKGIRRVRKAVGVLAAAAIICTGCHNIIYANGAYVNKKLVYDNTLLHAQTVWEDVNSIEGYEEGTTPVVFMGSFDDSDAAFYGTVGYRFLGEICGFYNSAITYPLTAEQFYNDILGRRMKISQDRDGLAEDPEVLRMSAYPRSGYCRMIGDRVVVKMQD